MSRIREIVLAALAASAVLGLAPSATAQLEIRSSYAVETAPVSVVAADFNRDGIMDMAVGSEEGIMPIQVFLGRADGTFGHPLHVHATGYILATGDLNGDGIPDLVGVNELYGVSVLLGNGDGTFKPAVTYQMPGGPTSVVLGDFNGDGNLDIAAADSHNGFCYCVSVLLGNGDGTFQEPPIITYPPFSLPEALTAGYFKGDKNLDLAVTLGFTSSDTVQILLGNGDGTFSVGDSYSIAPSSLSIVAADLRNNGTTDLVTAESGGMGVAVLLGNGDGTFEQPVVYDVNTSLAAAVGDMNGDGIPDLVALSVNNSGSVAIFPGNGDGTFGSPEYFYPTGMFPRALALADFNGDGQLDVTLADQTGDREYVLLNTGAAAFSPSAPLSFGKQQHGTTSAAKTVTLTNTGKATLKIHSMKALGQFGMTSTCGASVAANASCTISVTFSPTSAGGKIGTIEVRDSASSKPQVIALSGTGT